MPDLTFRKNMEYFQPAKKLDGLSGDFLIQKWISKSFNKSVENCLSENLSSIANTGNTII